MYANKNLTNIFVCYELYLYHIWYVCLVATVATTRQKIGEYRALPFVTIYRCNSFAYHKTIAIWLQAIAYHFECILRLWKLFKEHFWDHVTYIFAVKFFRISLYLTKWDKIWILQLEKGLNFKCISIERECTRKTDHDCSHRSSCATYA